MRRVVYLTWAVVVLCFLWLLPSTATFSQSGVGKAVGASEKHSPLVGWLSRRVEERRRSRRIKLYAEIYRFVAEHCESVWSGTTRRGFVALDSKRPQTVQEHRLRLRWIFIEEAFREGLSLSEIMEGVCGADVHETDEAASGKDKARLPLPSHRSRRARFVIGWWPDHPWIPQPGGLSEEWVASYRAGRSEVVKFLAKKRVRKDVAQAILRYIDNFHLGMSRVWVLLRDCHYLELVREGIREKVPARHFALDAVTNIVYPSIRLKVLQEYGEAVKRGEQEPLEIT